MTTGSSVSGEWGTGGYCRRSTVPRTRPTQEQRHCHSSRHHQARRETCNWPGKKACGEIFTLFYNFSEEFYNSSIQNSKSISETRCPRWRAARGWAETWVWNGGDGPCPWESQRAGTSDWVASPLVCSHLVRMVQGNLQRDPHWGLDPERGAALGMCCPEPERVIITQDCTSYLPTWQQRQGIHSKHTLHMLI